MTQLGQLYTAGVWVVKAGQAAAFVEAWQAFAEWSSDSAYADGRGHLLQDRDKPHRFLSFGSWESQERIAEWRSRPEFQGFIDKARDLCDHFQPMTMEQVAVVEPKHGKLD
jgi:quinol monooxygenase YgiN